MLSAALVVFAFYRPAPAPVVQIAAAGVSTVATVSETDIRPLVDAAVAKAVAAAKGCALVDLHDLWAHQFGPGWDAAYAAGLMHDGLHPTQRGHDHIAAALKERLELT